MRFNVGEKLFFVRVDYKPGEASFFNTLYMPWRGDTLNSIKVIQLEVIEHHKVPWDQDPKDEPRYDGFVMKEVTKDGHGDIFHNQYPDACYGQLDDTNDRVVFRQPYCEEEFWGARFTLLSSYLEKIKQQEQPAPNTPEDRRLPKEHIEMLVKHREEIEKKLKEEYNVEVTYTDHVMKYTNGRPPKILLGWYDANFKESVARASLADIRKRKDEGKLYHNPNAPEGETLGADFWSKAKLVEPNK